MLVSIATSLSAKGGRFSTVTLEAIANDTSADVVAPFDVPAVGIRNLDQPFNSSALEVFFIILKACDVQL